MRADLCFELADLFGLEAALPEHADELPGFFGLSGPALRNHALRLNSTDELTAIADYWEQRGREGMERV